MSDVKPKFMISIATKVEPDGTRMVQAYNVETNQVTTFWYAKEEWIRKWHPEFFEGENHAGQS